MTLDSEVGGRAATTRRVVALIVALIAGTMLAAWIAGLGVATRTGALVPMSPLACVGFLLAAGGVWALGGARPVAVVCGALAGGCGIAGLADVALDGGRTVNGWLGADVRVSALAG